MRNRALLKVVLLGLLTFALAPDIAGATDESQDLAGMLASSAAERAATVSAPTIATMPSSVNFGIVNAGTFHGPVMVRIMNTGTADLNISSMSAPSPFVFTDPSPIMIGVGSFFDVFVDFNPTDGARHNAYLAINSDAANGNVWSVPLAGRGNTAPVLVRTPSDASFNVAAFTTLHVDFTATDPEGDSPINWAIANQPFGSQFVGGTTDDGVSFATFHWATDPNDVGSHTGISVRATDPYGLYVDSFFDIFVSVQNLPPVAHHGGPYDGVRTVPVTFNGTGSSDPDGNNLTYAWSFGDGSNGTGAAPAHAYATAEIFIVTLTVTDDGSPSLTSDPVLTTATIIDFIPVQVTAKLRGGSINVHSTGGRQAMGMETIPATGLDPSGIDPTTVRLSVPALGATEITPDLKGSQVGGDLDGDGLPELVLYFRRSDLAMLLSGAANNSMQTFQMNALALDGTPVRGSTNVPVKTDGGNAVTSAAAPNPFNPETSISYSLRNEGPVSVRIYSVNGQLVRRLRDEYGTPGTHEVRWDGLDDRGNQVRSGIYFVSVVQGENRSQVKVVVVK